MSALVVLLLAAGAALLQAGALPAAFAHPLAAPVLPVSLIAGWAAVRAPREVMLAPLAAAVVLGALSEIRVGAFVLALLPATALVTAIRSRGRRVEAPARYRFTLASVCGAGGEACYVAVLALAGGDARAVVAASASIAVSACWTAVFAALLACALWPLRPRSAGLFA